MQIFHVKYEKKERCNMSYMVCHGMKSKAGDIKNIEKHIERKNKDYKNNIQALELYGKTLFSWLTL